MKTFIDIWAVFMITVGIVGFSIIGYLCHKLDKQMWGSHKRKHFKK